MTNKQIILNVEESKKLIKKLANAKKSDNIYTVTDITERELLQLECYDNWNYLDLMSAGKLENGLHGYIKYKETNCYKQLLETI